MKNKIFKKMIICILVISEFMTGINVFALTKEETVYTKLNNDGSINNISFREHLFDFKENSISDKTSLKNIKNINGKEEFEVKDGVITWKSNGKDIYYQGDYDGKLPISISIKYYLDNKEINAKDLEGRKGKVKIVYTFTNNLSKKVKINGKEETLYVPFMILTTTALNNTDNKNIKVSNGKVIDNGLTSMVVLLSSPGLYESLKINELKELNKVELSFDTENAKLGTMYSIATPTNLEDNENGLFSDINELYSKINLLQSNMNTIVDASNKLSNGSKKIDSGVTELNNKLQELIKKYNYYRNLGPDTLKNELIKIVEENLLKILPSLEEDIITETSNLIQQNKKELATSIIDSIRKNTKLVFKNDVNKVISNLDLNDFVNRVTNSNLLNTLKNDEEIKSLKLMLEQKLKEEITKKVEEAYSLLNESLNINKSNDEMEDYINNIASEYDIPYDKAKEIVSKVKTDTVSDIKTNLAKNSPVKKIISDLDNEEYLNNLINNYVGELNKKLQSFLESDAIIKEYESNIINKILDSINKDLANDDIYANLDIKNYIDDMINEIIDKMTINIANKYSDDYTKKVVNNIFEKQFSKEVVDSKLSKILNIYKDNIDEKVHLLDTTINTLSDSINLLNTGSKSLSNGMEALNKGLVKYNNEGISRLNKIVNVDVKTYQKRIEALMKLGTNYKTIDSINSNTGGSSKIIFMVE